MPWISLDDWLEATVFLLERDDIAGPVNVVAPEPVRNAEFTKAFGAALHRPTIMPVPGFALRIALGELSVEALASVRAVPGVLLAAGFTYRHADIADALRAAVS
jgi:NAD dependent epimerase/dehydratase family enzyme